MPQLRFLWTSCQLLENHRHALAIAPENKSRAIGSWNVDKRQQNKQTKQKREDIYFILHHFSYTYTAFLTEIIRTSKSHIIVFFNLLLCLLIVLLALLFQLIYAIKRVLLTRNVMLNTMRPNLAMHSPHPPILQSLSEK